MFQIENFKWKSQSNMFEWDYDRHYILEYKCPIKSIVVLRGNSGFAIVLSEKEYGRNNAFLLNADGSERFRVKIPLAEKLDADFCAMFYVGEELIAMISRPGFTQECSVNDQTGECFNIHMAK